MNLNEIPTPETDTNESTHEHFKCYGYENSLDSPMIEWTEFARDLERRLTVAREALELIKGYCNSENIEPVDCRKIVRRTTHEALAQTAPKIN